MMLYINIYIYIYVVCDVCIYVVRGIYVVRDN